MDTGVSSSLIPHDSVVSTRRLDSGGVEDVVFFFSIIALVVSGALAGAVYFYAQVTQSQITSAQANLEKERKALNQGTIDHLIRLNSQLHDANVILEQHLAPSLLFDELSKITLQTVSFAGLSYSAMDPKHVTITMSGVAKSYNSVAVQSQLFAASNVFKNPIFTGLSSQIDGVHFSVTAEVVPATIGYAQIVAANSGTSPDQSSLQQSSQQVQQQGQPQAPSPFGTPNSSSH